MSQHITVVEYDPLWGKKYEEKLLHRENLPLNGGSNADLGRFEQER